MNFCTFLRFQLLLGHVILKHISKGIRFKAANNDNDEPKIFFIYRNIGVLGGPLEFGNHKLLVSTLKKKINGKGSVEKLIIRMKK